MELVRYDAMRVAINACHEIDECKEIHDRSVAMAAYFRQVRDMESVRKFHEIKLRAIRRIGEICLGLDWSGHENGRKTAFIKQHIPAAEPVPDWLLYQAMKIAQLPQEGFEAALDKAEGNTYYMIYNGDPEAVAERQAEMKRMEAAYATREPVEKKPVGLTLEERHREELVAFRFLVSFEVHEQLRTAAFERRTTMWEIFRQALRAWFLANEGEEILTAPGSVKAFKKDEQDEQSRG